MVQSESLGLHCGQSPESGAVWWSVSASHTAGWGAGRQLVSAPHGWSRAHGMPETVRKHCIWNVQSRVLWAAFCKPSENLSP